MSSAAGRAPSRSSVVNASRVGCHLARAGELERPLVGVAFAPPRLGRRPPVASNARRISGWASGSGIDVVPEALEVAHQLATLHAQAGSLRPIQQQVGEGAGELGASGEPRMLDRRQPGRHQPVQDVAPLGVPGRLGEIGGRLGVDPGARAAA